MKLSLLIFVIGIGYAIATNRLNAPAAVLAIMVFVILIGVSLEPKKYPTNPRRKIK